MMQMEPKKVYACYNTNKAVRLSSSSGAVFSSLAQYVLKKRGIIYGVTMSDDCYSAKFIAVTNEVDMVRLRGSKYIQAKIGDTFNDVKKNLLAEKLVLFTGTGCQINGLKSFLGKDYDNLICVDIMCHGIPSPALWEKYVKYQEKKNDGKLKYINFRCKDDSWISYGMEEVFKGNLKGKEKKLYIPKDADPYMQMFLKDYSLRPSCYECVAKKEKKSDMTIADFWGIQEFSPEMSDNMGTSLVLIRTDKGQVIFNNISNTVNLKELSYEIGVKCNPAEYMSCLRPQQRDEFFLDMRSMDFEDLIKKYTTPIKYSLKTKYKIIVKKIIKSIR